MCSRCQVYCSIKVNNSYKGATKVYGRKFAKVIVQRAAKGFHLVQMQPLSRQLTNDFRNCRLANQL